jgi:hypothetical protein
MSVFGMSQTTGKVYLNVYDLHENNEFLNPIGLGFYHSGVQVGRSEYTFGTWIKFLCVFIVFIFLLSFCLRVSLQIVSITPLLFSF